MEQAVPTNGSARDTFAQDDAVPLEAVFDCGCPRSFRGMDATGELSRPYRIPQFTARFEYARLLGIDKVVWPADFQNAGWRVGNLH